MCYEFYVRILDWQINGYKMLLSLGEVSEVSISLDLTPVTWSMVPLH